MAEDPSRDGTDPRIAELETQIDQLTSKVRTIWIFLYVATLALLVVLVSTIQALSIFWPAFVAVGIYVVYLLLRTVSGQ